jgi:hypothetical protein
MFRGFFNLAAGLLDEAAKGGGPLAGRIDALLKQLPAEVR